VVAFSTRIPNSWLSTTSYRRRAPAFRSTPGARQICTLISLPFFRRLAMSVLHTSVPEVKAPRPWQIGSPFVAVIVSEADPSHVTQVKQCASLVVPRTVSVAVVVEVDVHFRKGSDATTVQGLRVLDSSNITELLASAGLGCCRLQESKSERHRGK
jgi:hypothetical protein